MVGPSGGDEYGKEDHHRGVFTEFSVSRESKHLTGRQVDRLRTDCDQQKKEGDYETQLWLANLDGSSSRVLTSAGTRNSSAVWARDGTQLAFVSNRALGRQVWLLPMEGGEARQVTRL